MENSALCDFVKDCRGGVNGSGLTTVLFPKVILGTSDLGLLHQHFIHGVLRF
jgi:hypothetical protein